MYSEVHMDSLYPDIVQCGSLGVLLRREFERIGSPLKAVGYDESSGGSSYWAAVRLGGRGGAIAVATKVRLFIVSFRVDGVQLGWMKTDSVDPMARALHAWAVERTSTAQLKAAFPEVCVQPAAASYEEGPKAYIESQWAELIARVSETLPELFPVVHLARDTAALRDLLPFTSHDILGFSRCTGYPFTRDCPSIAAVGENRFCVRGPSGERLGEGDAETAVKIARENLPENCGEAVHGTSDQHEGRK